MPLADYQRQALRAAQQNLCSLCKKAMIQPVADTAYTPDTETIDHVLPESRGGPDDFGNILLAHLSCNRAKGNNYPTPGEIAELRRVMALIPRGVMIQSMQVRIAHLFKRKKLSDATQQQRIRGSLGTLAPYVTPSDIFTALDIETASFSSELSRLESHPSKPVDVPTGAPSSAAGAEEDVKTLKLQKHPKPHRSAPVFANQKPTLPRLAFAFAALVTAAWSAAALLFQTDKDQTGALLPLWLVAAIHLVLVFAVPDRPRRPAVTKFISWLFLCGAFLLLASTYLHLLPVPLAISTFVTPTDASPSAPVLLGAGFLGAGWLLLLGAQTPARR